MARSGAEILGGVLVDTMRQPIIFKHAESPCTFSSPQLRTESSEHAGAPTLKMPCMIRFDDGKFCILQQSHVR